MNLLGSLELFSRTFENRFIFSLFDLLLCGVIVLVIVRGWRTRPKAPFTNDQLFLLLAFFCLGASFALEAASAGAFFFFRKRLPETLVDLLFHLSQSGAWVLLAVSAYHQPIRRQAKLQGSGCSPLLPCLFFAASGLQLVLPVKGTMALDLTNLVLLAIALVLFHRHLPRERRFAIVAVALLLTATLLHVSPSVVIDPGLSLVLWNLEQFAWSFSLFTFALAIGEASHDLFDKVFVRLQIAFILLASLMILVITQTEKADYLASIRDRSHDLAEFVRKQADYFRNQDESLPDIVGREDFLQRAIMGFGNLPELKVIRIITDSQVATFEIADDGEIYSSVETTHSPSRLESEEYFLIHALPLTAGISGGVEFYGTRQFIDQHIRKRILLIFTLFTGTVALSTLMIGLVVRGASAVMRQQAREIEKAQQQLIQASKLAAIGELAAGVAHEINNPATTILSMSSFWLSQEHDGSTACEAEDVRQVLDQAQRIAQITSALLTFSRRQALEIKPVPIDRVISTSLRLVDDLLAANRISVEKNLQPGLPSVLADEGSLIRVLENLFRNAIDAMSGGGTLQIRTSRETYSGRQIRLEITDTGIGMEKETLARVFDPFFTTKEVGKGTGLGLAIVHGIIKEHQGIIAIESEPGAGTKVTIVLPAEES
ncbi:MAG: ATP-binding protein [Acidobacteriota bacterium]